MFCQGGIVRTASNALSRGSLRSLSPQDHSSVVERVLIHENAIRRESGIVPVIDLVAGYDITALVSTLAAAAGFVVAAIW